LPAVSIQPFDVRVWATAVDGYEDREDEHSGWYEDFEEHSKVSEKKIGIQATFWDEFGIWRGEYWWNPAKKSVRRRWDPIFLGHKVCLWTTNNNISKISHRTVRPYSLDTLEFLPDEPEPHKIGTEYGWTTT
jgi:hypothetical protein